MSVVILPGPQIREMFLAIIVLPTYTTKTFFTDIAEAYDNIGIPFEEEETIIHASTWKEALLLRLNEPPAYQFSAKVWTVREESIEGEAYVQYTVTMEMGLIYIDVYDSSNEDYSIPNMFHSLDELKAWLKGESSC